jgi:hypothetical protein
MIMVIPVVTSIPLRMILWSNRCILAQPIANPTDTCIMVILNQKGKKMQTVKIAVELTVDLTNAEEIKDWLEDLIEKNFSEEGEEILSISLFG